MVCYIFQIIRSDFIHWEMYTTLKELRKAERDCNYPPRFQIICTPQSDDHKSLYCTFEVSKPTCYVISKQITGK